MSAGFEQWYIRIRGRVSGPYDLQRLRGLKARGRLSRVHEVSTDGTNWTQAASIYGLFEDDGAGVGAPGGLTGGGVDAGGDLGGYDLQSPVEEWYYAGDGGQQGPVSTAELQQMIDRQALSAETLVWRSGQLSWMPARDVPELGLALPMPAALPTPQPGGRKSTWIIAAVVVLLLIGLAGGGVFLARDRLFGDKFVVGNIESTSASKQISQAVGLVVSGWRTVDSANKREDRDYVLGGPFDGPYTKVTEGGNTVFNRVRPEDKVGVFKTAELYEKVTGGYRPLPASGLCVALEDSPSRLVHLLAGTGTCFMITQDGYALTNRHVVEETYNLQQATQLLGEITKSGGYRSVQPTLWVFFGEHQHNAEIVHVSDKYDLAILKIDGKPEFPHFALSKVVDEEHLPRGNKVYVLGFPGAAQAALSEQELQSRHAREEVGMLVSDKFSPSDYEYSQHDGSISKIVKRDQVGNVVQHNADINPGNSGGPLVTRDGRVHAINTATVKGASGIHFSIAIDQLRDEINDHVPTPPLWK